MLHDASSFPLLVDIKNKQLSGAKLRFELRVQIKVALQISVHLVHIIKVLMIKINYKSNLIRFESLLSHALRIQFKA
jgi:hypothetical protein